MRLSALIEEFLVDCRSRRLAPKTVSWYQANLRYFLDWLLAHDGADTLQAFTLTNARRYSQVLAERMARHGTFVGGAPRRGVYALVESDQRLKVHTITGYLRTLKTFSPCCRRTVDVVASGRSTGAGSMESSGSCGQERRGGTCRNATDHGRRVTVASCAGSRTAPGIACWLMSRRSRTRSAR